MRRPLLSFLACASLAFAGCVTDGPHAEKEPLPPPPTISHETPLDQALTAGIDYGSETLVAVKKLVKRRKEGDKAAAILTKTIMDNQAKYEPHQLVNAGHLLMATPAPLSIELFKTLVETSRPLSNQIGWHLASAKPSKLVQRAIEVQLTKAIEENDEDLVLIPQMANALAANRMAQHYTWARQGLMRKGNEEFARAMIALDPRRATDDFLVYLAQVPAEELRQLSVTTINPYSALAILQHMRKFPPSIGRPGFENLYFYAVSRNTLLSDNAQALIETYIPAQTEALAQMLAKHPAWVQIAYLENVRRKMTPSIGLLLGELKHATGEHDVEAEIDEIKL